MWSDSMHMGFLFGLDENILKLMVVMVAQLCKYTKFEFCNLEEYMVWLYELQSNKGCLKNNF